MARPTKAEVALREKEARGGFDAELAANQAVADEARAKAIQEDEENGLIHGMPVQEFNNMSYAQQMRVKMRDLNSSLANQETNQDVIDFQLLSNTNVQTIMAMTNQTQAELQKRANELEVTLKGTSAGDFRQGQ